jgi:hypothetical protein
MATTTTTTTNEKRATSDDAGISPVTSQEGDIRTEVVKETIPQRFWRYTTTPGHAFQIVIAAALAIAIGMAVTSTVDDIPSAVPTLVGIPGTLWLRALKAVGTPVLTHAIPTKGLRVLNCTPC